MMTIDVQTPRGANVTLYHREDTTDLSTIGAIFRLWGNLDDEYGLAKLHPRTFLDIGGHIGAVTVSVLVDNPLCRAVILEPLPENREMITKNLLSAEVADRAIIIAGAIGEGDWQRIGYTLARLPNADPIHRYVGSPVEEDYAGEAMTAPTYPLGILLDFLGERVDLAKVDCEGCEWPLLSSPDIGRVDRWVGEYHDGDPTRIGEALPEHEFLYEPHEQGGTGLFTAVNRRAVEDAAFDRVKASIGKPQPPRWTWDR